MTNPPYLSFLLKENKYYQITIVIIIMYLIKTIQFKYYLNPISFKIILNKTKKYFH